MDVVADTFANFRALRIKVPGFEELPLQTKQFIYWMAEAGACGHEIAVDQDFHLNLTIKRLLEHIYTTYAGDKADDNFVALVEFLKIFYAQAGLHHGWTRAKAVPRFGADWFREQAVGFAFASGVTIEDVVGVLFDPSQYPIGTASGEGDLVVQSAVNCYVGVTQAEVDAFYAGMAAGLDGEQLELGLNSTLVKEGGKLVEKTWKVGGLYSRALEESVARLEKAKEYAESEAQKELLGQLVEYYQTGSLRKWEEYCIAWVREGGSALVDFIHGFVEVYKCPRGRRGQWEALVHVKDLEGSKRCKLLSDNAQWFEDNSPTDRAYKKAQVVGVTAAAVNLAAAFGDSYPGCPIGINLPNQTWIRAQYGSKAVTLANRVAAQGQASKQSQTLDEFCLDEAMRAAIRRDGEVLQAVEVDLHETIGHASGQLKPGVDEKSLGEFHSPIEEARADLFALYYLADPKLVELKLLPDSETYKAGYYNYLLNGALVQLNRVAEGTELKEAHMVNRKLISEWVLANSSGARYVKVEGKTYIEVSDYGELRRAFGVLLKEIQRITSEGDYAAASELVRRYGTKAEAAGQEGVHGEVLRRWAALNQPKWWVIVQPRYALVREGGEGEGGAVVDVAVSYDEDLLTQGLRLSRDYGFLPAVNRPGFGE